MIINQLQMYEAWQADKEKDQHRKVIMKMFYKTFM